MQGKTFGSYRISRKLAQGAAGEIYAARHELMDRDAVVKILRPEKSVSERMVKRFFNEARAAASIRHPGIVEVFDMGYADDGRAYIVMERLDGEMLSSRLLRGRLSCEQVIPIARQLASALGAAHERNIVHRDLKPDNIYLVRDPDIAGGERIKILDFGIAKLTDTPAAAVTQLGSVIGTPAYMSPEQFINSAAVDHRTDIYALGCIAYECLCGRPPFGQGGLALREAHVSEKPLPPSRLEASVWPELEAVVLKLLAKSPDMRFQRCDELIGALDRVGGTAEASVHAQAPARAGRDDTTAPFAAIGRDDGTGPRPRYDREDVVVGAPAPATAAPLAPAAASPPAPSGPRPRPRGTAPPPHRARRVSGEQPVPRPAPADVPGAGDPAPGSAPTTAPAGTAAASHAPQLALGIEDEPEESTVVVGFDTLPPVNGKRRRGWVILLVGAAAAAAGGLAFAIGSSGGQSGQPGQTGTLASATAGGVQRGGGRASDPAVSASRTPGVDPDAPDPAPRPAVGLVAGLERCDAALADERWDEAIAAAEQVLAEDAGNARATECATLARRERGNAARFEAFTRAVADGRDLAAAAAFRDITIDSVYRERARADHEEARQRYLASATVRARRLADGGSCEALIALVEESERAWPGQSDLLSRYLRRCERNLFEPPGGDEPGGETGPGGDATDAGSGDDVPLRPVAPSGSGDGRIDLLDDRRTRRSPASPPEPDDGGSGASGSRDELMDATQ